ncbi:MAG TPA: GH1 family beta-glucosidase [Hyphomicrobiaceae bacterium]|jgi:beta-glucosidase
MAKTLTRRDLGKLAGASALATAPLAPSLADQKRTTADELPAPQFPRGFHWGVATSAYQIEGAHDADGKGKSIWDTYVHIPGKIRNGDTGDRATDHYHRYKQDVALMKSIGVTAYRFSIAWPRIFPDGTGQPNPKGVDFYSRLLDELRAADIEPFATLYHWDLPQALQDKHGGWQSREISKAFAEYSGYVARRLGDRIRYFITINEFSSFVDLGHRGVDRALPGNPARIELAPGLRLDAAALNQVRHHSVLAHGMAVQAIRAMGRPGTRIGPAEALQAAVPAIGSPEHVRAAETATRELNAAYLAVMLEGRYPDAYLRAEGRAAPRYTDDDLRVIASPVDFVGINVYVPRMYVLTSDRPPGYREVRKSASHPKMLSPWHTFGPEVMYWAPKQLHSIWKPKEIYITENGCAASDEIDADGQVLDSDRVMYFRNGMAQLQRACAEGVPVKGNFVWSAMDNFEWTDGYGARFGIVYVDFATQRRTPKLSARWYREAARRNAVV